MQVEKVLVSKRDPAKLSATERNLLRHCFGDDVILERTEIDNDSGVDLLNLEHPIVLPLTMKTKWAWLLLAAPRGRPDASVIVRMPDGFQLGLLPA